MPEPANPGVARLATRLAAWLNRGWRLVGTAISFIMFGFIGLFLGLLVFPLLFVVQRDAAKRQWKGRRCIGWAFALLIRLMKTLGVLSYQVVNRERLKGHVGTLVIANHPSLIDVVFLIAYFPQAECVVKQAVMRNVFMRSGATAANYISNEDPLELLDACTRRLKQGANLVLFPEATRSIPGQPLEFKVGAAAVAVRAGSPILPIVIRCTPTTLTKGEPWYHIPPRKPHWTLEVLPTIQPPPVASNTLSSRQEIRQLNQQLCRLFEDRLAELFSKN